ncbi:MAG: phosphopentomutase [Gammaproteobacteria bacterium]|nr:phosphopentomutase [Gammaproteobacteria bacterium]
MKRAFILLLDSFGIGYSPDAHQFGDEGANTLRHIAQKCAEGKANAKNIRSGPLKLPNLTRLGLHAAVIQCNGEPLPEFSTPKPQGAYGYAQEISFGKDTPSGHWEIVGLPALFDWGYFPSKYPSFPEKLITEFIKQAKIPGILGNKHASGTDIIKELGDEHVRTGKPIVYTSADSVFQIAAHEESFGLARLYEICKIARQLVDDYHVGRVIARPFIGTSGNYYRTPNRKDYTTPPFSPTLLDKIIESGGSVIGVGKIGDIFGHKGISKEVKGVNNMELFDVTVNEVKMAGDQTLIFTNFVDFDMQYGHRRDVVGYAHALEQFDRRLPEFEKILQPDDMMIITADHGCDPTFQGTDHTREYIPILIFGPKIMPKFIGKRETFADIGQTLATYFALKPLEYGQSFLLKIRTL